MLSIRPLKVRSPGRPIIDVIECPTPLTMHQSAEMKAQWFRATGRRAVVIDSGLRYAASLNT